MEQFQSNNLDFSLLSSGRDRVHDSVHCVVGTNDCEESNGTINVF